MTTEVCVRLISGKEHSVPVQGNATVSDLRKAIEDVGLCPIPCQQLFLEKEPLNDSSQNVAEFGNSTISLVIGVSHGVHEIHLKTGDVVDYVCIKLRDGSSSTCGQQGGTHRKPFIMEPGEYIVEVHWWREELRRKLSQGHTFYYQHRPQLWCLREKWTRVEIGARTRRTANLWLAHAGRPSRFRRGHQ